MKRFIKGAGRSQSTLFPECLEAWISEDNPVRLVDVFADELDLGAWALAVLTRRRRAGVSICSILR